MEPTKHDTQKTKRHATQYSIAIHYMKYEYLERQNRTPPEREPKKSTVYPYKSAQNAYATNNKGLVQ